MLEVNRVLLKRIVENALNEDIGSGDLTTEIVFNKNEIVFGKLVAKEAGIIAGLPVAELVFKTLDSGIKWRQLVADGTKVSVGDNIAEINGSVQAILSGERTALNFLQRLSAIATKTNLFAEKAAKFNVKILDTRKTTPVLRALEKYAVRVGGGVNHRFGLYDAAMIKDNHIEEAGSIARAVALLKESLPMTAKIEVEIQTMEQIEEALACKVDIIMLDNMPSEEMKKVVDLIDGKALVEASGKMSLDSIDNVAACGVNYISVGALTHSIQSLDISLDLYKP